MASGNPAEPTSLLPGSNHANIVAVKKTLIKSASHTQHNSQDLHRHITNSLQHQRRFVAPLISAETLSQNQRILKALADLSHDWNSISNWMQGRNTGTDAIAYAHPEFAAYLVSTTSDSNGTSGAQQGFEILHGDIQRYIERARNITAIMGKNDGPEADTAGAKMMDEFKNMMTLNAASDASHGNKGHGASDPSRPAKENSNAAAYKLQKAKAKNDMALIRRPLKVVASDLESRIRSLLENEVEWDKFQKMITSYVEADKQAKDTAAHQAILKRNRTFKTSTSPGRRAMYETIHAMREAHRKEVKDRSEALEASRIHHILARPTINLVAATISSTKSASNPSLNE